MRLTFEKRTADRLQKITNFSDLKSIKELLGRQNKIESKYIGFFPQSNQIINSFLKSFIGPGDEVLTVGPGDENIYRAITSCGASYVEFYEKPPVLPDLSGIVGQVTNRTKLIILGNPNRYTGLVYSHKEIENILDLSGNITVVLDESTFESSLITAFDLIKKYDNLALIRSLENDKNGQSHFIIGNSSIIEKIENKISDRDYNNTDLSAILYNLKNRGKRLGRLKDARQEMLYLSIRLKMFDLRCFLNPDYSLVVKTAASEKLLSLLNATGIRTVDMARYPGFGGNILIPFNLDIDAMSIINIFEKLLKNKNYDKPKPNRLTIHRPSELDSGTKFEWNREIIYGNRLESNKVI